MRNIQLVSQRDAIQSLIERTATATQGNIELQGHWGKYLCVLVSGLLENSIKEIYGDFARRAASPQVARYATAKLDGIQNPNAQRFIQTANEFSEEWSQSLAEYLDFDGKQRRTAIDSIIGHRHKIVHGRIASISVARVKEYLGKAVEVIDFVEAQCAGN